MKFELYEQKIERIEAEVEAFDLAHPKSVIEELETLAKEEAIENELAEGEQTKWKLRCGIEIEQGIRQFLL